MSGLWEILRRLRQHGGCQIFVPFLSRQHVLLPQGVLAQKAVAQFELERGREVLPDAQQLQGHSHFEKRFLGSVEPCADFQMMS
jgi:hypothetical protein